MATFNGGAFLPEQLASIDRQQRLPDEIVISDDCSDDDTLRIATGQPGSTAVPRRVLNNATRSGVIENFSKAFRACNGDIYCYCDQDDVWHPRRLAILIDALEAPGVTLAFHPSRLMSADLGTCSGLSPTGIKPGIYHAPLPGGRLWGYGHQMVFRSAVWKLADRILSSSTSPKPRFVGNFDILLIGAAGLLGDVVYVPDALVDFRRHAQSTSPAGKALARQETLQDRLARQHAQIALQLDSLSSWRDFLERANCVDLLAGLVPDPVARAEHYQAKARAHEASLRQRLRIYDQQGMMGRIHAMIRAATSGAYGNVYQGKLPPRLVAGDLAAALLAQPAN